jgi:RND family efflux transporter MFP subunit
MAAIEFLALWAFRSSVLILTAALLLRLLRVHDPAVRLAAWTAALCASLALPALTGSLPKLPVPVRPASAPLRAPTSGASGNALPLAGDTAPLAGALPTTTNATSPPPLANGVHGLAETRAQRASAFLPSFLLLLYTLGALALLFRFALGLTITFRLLNRSRATGEATEGIEIRESEHIGVPVALGIARPAIVLPADWREWDAAKLAAILAHERAHIRRHDPAVQALSAIHRALLWHSPLSWFLHARIVRAAEEASDDAALAATPDRGAYAEVVLDFVRRAPRPRYAGTANWLGAPMARYGRPDKRIHRILDGTSLSRGVTRRALAAILVIASPLAYVAAAAHPQSATQAPASAANPRPAPQTPSVSAGPAPAIAGPSPQAPAPGAGNLFRFVAWHDAAQSRQGSPKQEPPPNPGNIPGLGQVAPSATVTIRPRIDGQLESVNFKEGAMVKKGQLLATIGQESGIQAVVRADRALAQDNAELKDAQAFLDGLRKQEPARLASQSEVNAAQKAVDQAQDKIVADKGRREDAQRQLNFTQVESPIDGLAGFLQVDPGNMVHPNDAIVVVTQVQPIDVIFTIPEDELFQVRDRLAANPSIPVEAWNRDESRKLATGRLIAIDNQIDPQTGTAKLKAEFANTDNALFPGLFVNVRLLMTSK